MTGFTLTGEPTNVHESVGMMRPVGGFSSIGFRGSSTTSHAYGGMPPATTSGIETNWLNTIGGRDESVAITSDPMPITQWYVWIDTVNGEEPVSVRRSVKSNTPS